MFHAAELFGQNVHLFLTEPRRSPAAAGLPRPEAGSGAPEGLGAEPLECISARRMLSVPYLRRERHDAVLERRARRGPQRPEERRRRRPSRTGRPASRPPGSSSLGGRWTSTPSPSAASAAWSGAGGAAAIAPRALQLVRAAHDPRPCPATTSPRRRPSPPPSSSTSAARPLGPPSTGSRGRTPMGAGRLILRGRGRSAVADAPFRPRESQVRTRAQVIRRRGRRPRGPPRSTGAGEGVLSQADPRRWRCRR